MAWLFLKNKGFSLVEVILSIALIGLIAVAFLPLISVSYTSIIKSDQFTTDMYNDQALVEKEIDKLRFEDPVAPNNDIVTFFGVDVPVHNIQENTSNSGEVHLLLPKQTRVPPIPLIESPPKILIRNSSDVSISPIPAKIDLLNGDKTLFVNEITITDDTQNDYLMSVYRWYITGEVIESYTPTTNSQDYTIIHEWNEARMLVPLTTALENNFVPNFKEYVDPGTNKTVTYNRLNFGALGRHGNMSYESLVNRYGNRYVVYGVTPYSLSGRMGQERFSNAIYISAPRITVESAVFDLARNAVVVRFNHEVNEDFEDTLFKLNPQLGEVRVVVRDPVDHNLIIIELEDEITVTQPIQENYITRGALASKEYGSISIWSEEVPNGAFNITFP